MRFRVNRLKYLCKDAQRRLVGNVEAVSQYPGCLVQSVNRARLSNFIAQFSIVGLSQVILPDLLIQVYNRQKFHTQNALATIYGILKL